MADEERTILVVDADENVQQKIVEVMADKPCRFVLVDQADDAVVQFAMEGPHFVILSLELPDGDGVDVMNNIRDFDNKVPILIMTGAPTKEKLIAAKKIRPADILLKPPDYGRIRTKLSAHLWISEELLKSVPQKKAAAPPAGDKGAPAKQEEPKKEVKEEDKTFEQLASEALGKATEGMSQEDFVEAIPKGAELLNINDTIGGMKIAKTLIWNDVVYGDKGEILTDKKIGQLSRMGVPEICVYIDAALKKKVEQRKKMEAAKPAMGAQTSSGEKVFAKVKRVQVRVKIEEPAKIMRKLMDGSEVEIPGLIADVSGGGCALLTKEPLTKNEEILVNFSLDEGSFPMENIKGVVRHSMRRFGTEDFPQRSGIYFSNVTERFRENLITKLFKIERDNKKKEDELRARYGYGPKKHRRYE